MKITNRSPDHENTASAATVPTRAPDAHNTQAAHGTDSDQPSPLSRAATQAHSSTAVSDAVPHAAQTHEPFIVTCPGCGGSGRVLRDGSQVRLSCRLCWERGVVARIVADKYLRNAHSSSSGTSAGKH